VTAGEPLATYEAFAAVYNDFNYRNDYEQWLGAVLLPELEARGLRRGRVLDVGCGTGRAFEPLLKRGWEIVGCDLSPSMVAVAEEDWGERAELHVADMRELPVYGEFELVLCLNDALNYLLDRDELQRALAGFAANLGADGLALFDLNALSAFRTTYGREEAVIEFEGRSWTWTGLGDGETQPGGLAAARIAGDDLAEPVVNQERHFPPAEVEATMRSAGLEPLAMLGMRENGSQILLEEPVDEERDYKFVCIARLADKDAERVA
jgi:SAM-dependent methyltransferase